MKLSKIISIAVINGLTMLLLASLLASCQKNTINSKGLFTVYGLKDKARKIASVKTSLLTSLEKQVDLKQIYIYCSLNDVNPEQCYQKNVNTVLSKFEKSVGPLDSASKDIILQQTQFLQTQVHTEELATSMLEKMGTHISQLINKRENFCRLNSKHYKERCLGQYIDQDTMVVLNTFQQHHQQMNGHEYLFLKNKIKNRFLTDLKLSLKKLETEEKRS